MYKIEKIKKFVNEEADLWQDTYCDSMRNNILSFLDTLMEESDKSLEEAAEEYIKNGRYLPEAWVVRPAFTAGAEWQASQMPMPEDTVLFNKGVAEGRRLEREDSVECEVTDVGFNYLDLALFDAESLGLKDGDKVKLIIIKDDGQD